MAGTAGAAVPKDDLALKLDQDAMSNDYLAMKFADSDKKLRQGLAICGKTGCSPNVLAQLHRDLGILYVVWNRPEEGKEHFAQALQYDPGTTIPKDLVTPEVTTAFAASAKQAGGAPRAGAPPPTPETPARGAPASSNEDIIHTPPAEQATLTAVPLFAEVSEDLSPAKVVVRYKVFGGADWKTADMRRVRKGYGVELPCEDMGTTPGDLKYYIQVLGPDGEVLAAVGSRKAPLRVAIKNQIAGEPPRLPGRRAPARCAGGESTECPPDLPGCGTAKKSSTGTCGVDSDCQSGSCIDEHCTDSASTPTGTKCETDRQCGAGYVCKTGFCEANPKKNWFGLAAQQDIIILPAAQYVCFRGTLYSCVQGDGTYYDTGKPETSPAADEVKAQVGAGTTRILLTYDRPVSSNFALGGRIGYAFGGGPDSRSGSPFLPVHVEARVSLFFGSEPFIRTGFRPYLVASFGVAQIDASVPVVVVEQDPQTGAQTQTGTLIAWKRTGALFGSGGLGMLYALGRNTGFFVDVRGQRMFPNLGTAIPIQIGYVVGL